VLVAAGTLATKLFAVSAVDNFKAGRGRVVTAVLRDGSVRPGEPSEALLIGTTTRFVMLYDPVDSLIDIVPIENLAKLTVSPGHTLRTPARSDTPPFIPQK
jgi:hypothetical protein